MEKIICFCDPEGEEAYLSNWAFSMFRKNGVEYFAMEQYIAHQKAVVFGDQEIAAKVMASFDFEEMKALGRQVRNYNNRVWNGIRQNPDLKEKLLATGDAVLAEAEESDSIWGIGLSMENPARLDMDCWDGQNLLGFALMQVRETLKNE